MLSDFATLVAGQWKVISQALPTFVIGVLACAVAVWLFARNHFSGQIEVLKERISLRDDQLAILERKLGAESPGDALVKLGELTEKMEALSVGKWDVLTPAQVNDFRERLRAIPSGELNLHLAADARALGYQIDNVFDELGWKINGTRVLGGGFGIKVSPRDATSEAIADVLRKASGLEVEIGDSLQPLTLYLGERPY